MTNLNHKAKGSRAVLVALKNGEVRLYKENFLLSTLQVDGPFPELSRTYRTHWNILRIKVVCYIACSKFVGHQIQSEEFAHVGLHRAILIFASLISFIHNLKPNCIFRVIFWSIDSKICQLILIKLIFTLDSLTIKF